MRVIEKVAAIAIRDNGIFMVRKHGADVWTNLGGRPESGETEEETLRREVAEEAGCEVRILEKLGDFEAPAALDPAIVRLHAYLVDLIGPIKFDDPELAEWRYISSAYREEGIKLPESIEFGVIPACVSRGFLCW